MSLDQHCHLTDTMMEACDLILCFKEYPHDDASDRAEELFDLAHQTATGVLEPVMRRHHCGMINMYLTKTGTMPDFVDRMTALEAEPGILSVSLIHGFPWGDVADVGAQTLVVTDGDPVLAQHHATRLGHTFFDLRNEVSCKAVPLNEALEQATMSPNGPVVLADMGDNSGAGAPGDSTFMLRALLDRGLGNVATGIYWDPMVVRICEDAGEGGELTLRLGGESLRAIRRSC